MARILIADDEDLERAALRFIIAGSGLEREFLIDEARNGHEAVRLGKSRSYEAIFLDIRMPGLDGLQVADELRRGGVLAPIVIISAFDTFEYAQKAIRLGVYEYLLKPAGTEDVVSALRRTLAFSQEPGVLSRKKEESITAISEATRRLESVLVGQMKSGGLDGASAKEFEGLASLNGLSRSMIAFRACGVSSAGQPSMGQTLVNIGLSFIEKALRSRARKVLVAASGEFGFALIYGLDERPESAEGEARSNKGKAGHESAQGGFQRNLKNDPLWPIIEAASDKMKDSAPSTMLCGIAGPSMEDADALFGRAFEGARLASTECPVVRLVPAQRSAEGDIMRISAADASPRSLGMRTLDYIKKHYSEDLTLVSAAEKLGVNSFHLSHAISKELGLGFSELLRRVRINKAKELMIGGGSIKEASYLVGFADQAYFSRVFKKLEGINPRRYIEQTAKKYKK